MHSDNGHQAPEVPVEPQPESSGLEVQMAYIAQVQRDRINQISDDLVMALALANQQQEQIKQQQQHIAHLVHRLNEATLELQTLKGDGQDSQETATVVGKD